MAKFILIFILLLIAIFCENIIIAGFFIALFIFAIHQEIEHCKKLNNDNTDNKAD